MSTESSAEIEIYPMPSFSTLVVSDIQASARWYCDVLGFTNIFTMPGPNDMPTLVHLRWIKYADLLLFPDRDKSLANKPKGIGIALNYSIADIEDLAKRARQRNADIVEGPINRPWNICELVILDPDGYRLVFNSPLLSGEHRSFDEIVASVSKGFKD